MAFLTPKIFQFGKLFIPNYMLKTSLSTIVKNDNIQLEYHNHVAWIRLNRPERYNALSNEMYVEMADLLKQIGEDDNVRIALMTGNGPYFSSGNDLNNFGGSDMSREKLMEKMANNCKQFVDSFIDFPKPLIGAINGPAYGIMFTILGLFDYLIATDRAYFVCPFSSLAISPEGCSTYTFPHIFGSTLASDLLFFNKRLSVEDAYRFGFISEIVPHDKFDDHLQQWINEPRTGLIDSCHYKSMISAKSLIRNDKIRQELHETNQNECKLLLQHFLSDECQLNLNKFFSRKK